MPRTLELTEEELITLAKLVGYADLDLLDGNADPEFAEGIDRLSSRVYDHLADAEVLDEAASTEQAEAIIEDEVEEDHFWE
ncbi:MAG: hypothetical protein ABEK12_02280 [Candidatus Nanohaloarchaea archaeon]